MTEHVNTNRLFSSIDKWVTFLHQQNPKRVTGLEQHRGSAMVEYGYKTPVGVTNSINFRDNLLQTLPQNYEPVILRQKYSNRLDKFETGASLSESFLFNYLDMILSTKYLTGINVRSQSNFSGGKWDNFQSIYMSLNKNYFNRLKAKNLVPNNSSENIFILHSENGIEVAIASPEKNKLILAHDTFRRICQDTDFDFEFDGDAGVIKGTIGNTSFDLHHTKATTLDPDKIWETLTGNNPQEPFIFPVHVK